MINVTFVINPVRPTFINKCLETLYKYTDMTDKRVVVVDQTLDGLPDDKRIHLKLRPHRNLGFSKSMNEGIIHGYQWSSAYVVCMNDDIEFINKAWWDGIIETFNQDPRIMGVNPMSPREPGWGYGWDHGKYIDLIEYKEEYDEKDYQYLLKGDFSQVQGLPDTFPRQKTGVIDGIATWCTVFKREFFDKFGLFEERYYPGGGEDYDMDARCYREGYRMVGTTRSWVWHHWGSSKDYQEKVNDTGLPIVPELCWANGDALWNPEINLTWNDKEKKMVPMHFDPWGKVTLQDGSKKPMIRDEKIGITDI
jgi:GT2 family glycosyltransferase